MAATYPTYKLRVDWGETGLFDQTGTELSSRLLFLEYWGGRDDVSTLVGKAVAGGLVAILNNNSGDYSSFNTSSPLTGNVGPDKPVRLTATGRAAQFVAANSEMLDGGDVLDITTQDFSIAFWIYVDTLAQMGVVNKRDRASSTNLGYAIELQLDGTFDAFISDGTSVTTISSTTTITAGVWNLVIFTADRSGNGQFYINDGAAEGATDISSQASTITNAIAFQLGAGFSTSADRFFGGRKQSVAIYTKLLTSTERTFLHRDGDGVQHKDIGLTGDGSTLKTSLLEWFDLLEESGNRTGQENSTVLTDTNTVLDAEGIPNFSLWKGFLRTVEPMPSTSGLNTARLTAVGPLGQVNQNKIRLATVTNELTGTAHDRMLTEANWPTADRTTDAGKTTMTRFGLENEVRVINALRRVEITESGFVGESKDGRIVFEDRRHRQVGVHQTSQATFSDVNGAALSYSRIRQLDSQRQVFHIFTVPVQTYTVGSLAVLWTLSSSGANSPSIEPGESVIFWAEFPVFDSPTNSDGVNAWTTLVENTDYEANTQAGGGGSDISTDVGVALSKFYKSMKITLTNNGAVKMFITLLQGRGTPVTKDDVSKVQIETSAAYPRTFPNPPQHVPNIAEALDWANWHNGLFSVVQPLLELEFLGNRSAEQMKQAMALGVSDRITVRANADTGLGLNEDFFIEHERHRVNPVARTHWTTWRVSALASSDAWTLGVSQLGSTTRLAYA